MIGNQACFRAGVGIWIEKVRSKSQKKKASMSASAAMKKLFFFALFHSHKLLQANDQKAVIRPKTELIGHF